METNERQEDWESLGLSNDFLFGKVMSNPKLCIKLLERIFPELEIERIEYPELQKSIKEDVDARSVRLDVYVKDSEEKVYDIEMQTTNNGELPKRSRYYQGMIDLQLINRGESYRGLNQSYIIFICMEDIFKDNRHIYTFENICIQNNGIVLRDGAVKIFLNTKSVREDVTPQLKAFLDYVDGRKTPDPYVEELEKAVAEAKKNRKWRHEYMTLLMRDQENIEKGRIQGRKEGIKEGIREERRKIIINMLSKGYTNEQIMMLCDTSYEEVNECKKSL